MELYWIKYNSKPPRRMLLIALGEYNGKLCCLDANSVEPRDKEFIRAKANYLDKLGLKEKINLIKEVRPGMMKHFKTINIGNLIIEQRYKIGSKKS